MEQGGNREVKLGKERKTAQEPGMCQTGPWGNIHERARSEGIPSRSNGSNYCIPVTPARFHMVHKGQKNGLMGLRVPGMQVAWHGGCVVGRRLEKKLAGGECEKM